MSTLTTWHDRVAARASRSIRNVAVWAIIAFCIPFAVAYSPNVLEVFEIHDNYFVLNQKSAHNIFHLEAEHMLSVGRPVAALLTNLPVWLVETADDFRWVRVFAILNFFAIGGMMIAACIFRLQLRPPVAVAVTLSAFFLPCFNYSTLDASAWAPHVLCMLIVMLAYSSLGRSNANALAFLVYYKRGDFRAIHRAILAYCQMRPVWQAGLVFQVALYDYPPYALVITAFPVICLFASEAPWPYRTLLALRDLTFISVSLLSYAASMKLFYLPFARFFTLMNTGNSSAYENEYVANLYSAYRFVLNVDPVQWRERLEGVLGMAGDLWFAPQFGVHVVVLWFLVGALAVALGVAAGERLPFTARSKRESTDINLRLADWLRYWPVAAMLLAACFLLAAIMVLAPAGGFVIYRTAVAPMVIGAIVVTIALSATVQGAWRLFGNPLVESITAGDVVLIGVAGLAFFKCYDTNFKIMWLGRNEFSYFSQIVAEAIANKSKTIFIIDPRREARSSIAYDRGGTPLPAYDLACFDSYCINFAQSIPIAAERLGRPRTSFATLVPTVQEPVPGLTCEMLTSRSPFYPPNASERSIGIIDNYRTLTPLTCVVYDEAWHDLRIDLSRK